MTIAAGINEKAAPTAVILVATDPPEPLAAVARRLAGHDRVLSAGTGLDSLRFRLHLAERLGASPGCVEANVAGGQGVVEVLMPEMSAEEKQSLEQSAEKLRASLKPFVRAG